MKSLPVVSALMVLAHSASAGGLGENDSANPLIGVAKVEEPPLVLVALDPDGQGHQAGSPLKNLERDLREAGAHLQVARRTVEAVVEERDQAREEVGALTMANHRMLMQIRKLQQEKEESGQELAARKARAGKSIKPATGLRKIDVEMAELKGEFQALRGDLVRVRQELKDPIERAKLREELIAARAHGRRLEREIATVKKSGEEVREVAARKQMELTARISSLSAGAGSSNRLRDDLRSSRAGHMKALVDVELLKKDLGRASEREEKTLSALLQAQRGVEALQAEKAAVAQSRVQALRDRDEVRQEVESLRQQIAKVRSEREESRASVAQLTAEIANSRSAHGETLPFLGTAAEASHAEGVPLASPGELIDKELEQGLPQGAAGSRVSDSGDP
jgi:chromosome segregation ATPase